MAATNGGFVVHSFAGDDPLACKDHVRKLLGMDPFKANGHAKPAKKTYFTYHDETGAIIYQVEGRIITTVAKRSFSNGGRTATADGSAAQGVSMACAASPIACRSCLSPSPMTARSPSWKARLRPICFGPGTSRRRATAAERKIGGRHSAYLSGADTIVLPDNDDPGRLHLDAVARSLKEVGRLDLPGLGLKGDVIDWAAAGGTREQLDDLIENTAQPWTAEASSNGEDGTDSRSPKKPPSRVIGAGTFMRSYAPISYTVEGLLPSGFFYALTAKTGAGKTAFAQALTFAVTMNRPVLIGAEVEPGRVAYVTLENPDDFKMKLAVGCYVHGISWDKIEPRLAIIEGRDTPEQIIDGLKLDAKANGSFQHVNIDALQAGFAAAGGGKFNDNESILAYVMRLRALTGLPGKPSVLVLCHLTKNATEDDLQPYGGGATINELDGNLTLWKLRCRKT
jgi:hypothetical protein